MNKEKITLHKFRFLLFYNYLKIIHNFMYYKKTYYIGRENIPHKGIPLLIVSNHQNAINDALAIEFAFKHRIVSIFSRGDVFEHKIIAAFLRFLYILPAYRLSIDGENKLANNYISFEAANKRLLSGGAIAIFPESTNQDKHWLGEFSLAYLRMAFSAAEEANFEKDIQILPIANHYSNYFLVREALMLKIGTPISLQPYYDLYKTKPRTAQRQVNQLVYQQIADMMLNVSDVENYEAIDYLRTTYGKRYAENHGFAYRNLPQQLQVDKDFVACLDKIKSENGQIIDELYQDTLCLKKATLQHKVRDWNFDKPFSAIRLVLQAFVFVVLFPAFIFALIPNILLFYVPKPMADKFKAKGGNMALFAGGIQIVLNALFVIPISFLLVFVADILLFNCWIAIIHLLALPLLGIFAWHYRLQFIKWCSRWRFRKLEKKADFQQIIKLRDKIRQQLDLLLK